MPPPDWPRLPPNYHFSPSNAITSSVKTVINLGEEQDDDRNEAAVRAAVALAQAAHAGEDRYAFAVANRRIVEGEVEREEQAIGQLLADVTGTREGTDSGEMRMVVLYEVKARQTTPLHITATRSNSDSLQLQFDFDTTLLPALEAEWFLSHVSVALVQILQSPTTSSISSVLLAPSSESSTLLKYSTDPTFSPSAAYPDTCRTLPDFFLHAANLYPDDEAISFLPEPSGSNPHEGEISLSYSQTLYLARYLASHLLHSLSHSLSSFPNLHATWEKGNLILPLSLSKSPLLPLSLLAISLTGCGYLALEPSFPEERKRGICEELRREGLLAPVAAVVQDEEGERGKWEAWRTTETGGEEAGKGSALFESVIDPEPILGPLLGAVSSSSSGRSSAQQLEKDFPLLEVKWPNVRKEGLAYVIYTSGTTGIPKGIMVEHRQVGAFLRNYRGVFGRARGERVLQFPSYSFDVSVMNIWDTFAHGSTLCITTQPSLLSSLVSSILALRCTLVDLTPTVSAVLFEHPDAQPVEGESVQEAWERAGFRIKQVNTGGERVEKAVREKWRERGVRVVIDYGPTETTVGVISNRSLASSPPSPFSLPIGKPTGSTRIHILSPSPPSLHPVPLGAIGEICVSGPQVTRGYVLPHLNEGVFIEMDGTEGWGEKGERVYRTGDLGRWVVAEWEEGGEREGWVECLGRRDGQVKVNGLRIEVGEIEEHLSSRAHPSLLRGIVDTFETPSVSSSLVAYLELGPAFSSSPSSLASDHSSPVSILPCTTCSEFTTLVAKLKSYLAKKLPQYMVPRYWLAVSRVPTQGMGKADKRTLRALAQGYDWRGAARSQRQHQSNGGDRLDREDEGEAERTFTRDSHHQAARTAWAAVLRLSSQEGEQIADQDEFMKLGGDSIRFMKLVSTLKIGGGYSELRFRDVVDAATLGECAGVLAACAASSPASTSSIPPVDVSYRPFSLIPPDALSALLDELDSFSPSLPSDRISDVYPTAPSQDALLAPSFSSQIGHYYAQAIYHVGVSSSQLSTDKLQEGLVALVGRYEALRSVFVVSEVRGMCVVALQDGDEEVRDRTTMEEVEVGRDEDLDAVITDWLKRDRERFTFRWGRLHLSFALFTTPSETRKLAWGMHHAMSDGWTLELLTADLRSLCFGLKIPPRPPFSSVAAWWRSTSEPASDTVDFWRSYLTSSRPLGWPSQVSLDGGMLATTGAAILPWHGELETLTQKHGITPAIASRLAISVALSHHAAADDVVVGIVRSGRDIDVIDADEIIGPCVSVLPSRTRFSSASSSDAAKPASSLLSLAKAEASADRLARVHQRITLPSLARACSLPSRTDLFSILITFQSLAERSSSFDNAAPWPVRQPPERIHMPTNYALSFEVTPQLGKKDELELACFFDERIVDKKQVDGVLESVAKVLDYLVTAPCTLFDEVKATLAGGRKQAGPGGAAVPTCRTGGGTVGEEVEDEGSPGAEVVGLIGKLRREWAAVLRLEDFDDGESFSSLGGDSIAAMRLAVRLQKAGLAIPAQVLAKLPTLRRQAEWLTRRAVQ
ncbi:hypothetical protein JCM11641_000978 [Rhodosporidiobolus odoratus]